MGEIPKLNQYICCNNVIKHVNFYAIVYESIKTINFTAYQHHIHFFVFVAQSRHIWGAKYRYPKGLDMWSGLLYPLIFFFLHFLQLYLAGDSGTSFS